VRCSAMYHHAEQDALPAFHRLPQAGVVVHGPGCAAAAANPRLAMATHISQAAKLWVAAQLRANLRACLPCFPPDFLLPTREA
jgi:hypothetical protein